MSQSFIYITVVTELWAVTYEESPDASSDAYHTWWQPMADEWLLCVKCLGFYTFPMQHVIIILILDM